MNYKIFRVEFANGTHEYDIPTGWQINQTLFCTDSQAVFVLSQQAPVDFAAIAQTNRDTFGTLPTAYAYATQATRY